MAEKIYGAFSLTGGGFGSLDSYNGTILVDGDVAIVFAGTNTYRYVMDIESGAAESSPDVIAPDTSPGSKRWLLVPNPFGVTAEDVGLGNVANVDTSNASNITTGTLPSSVIPPIALVSVQVAADESAQLALTTVEGDIVVRTDETKTYMKNSGTADTMADFTELQTPPGSVISVNNQTGAVVLTKADVGLGNVPNTDFTSSVAANTSHRLNSSNPHNVNAAVIGLGNVQNTDLTPAVESNTSHSTGNGSDHADVASNTTHRGLTAGNPHAVTKANVGLSNVENRLITISTGDPSGGVDGDIWLKY